MGPGLSTGLAAAALVPIAILSVLVRRWRRRRGILRIVEAETTRHARLLSVKQRQLVVHDGYGNTDIADWIRHANYFIDNVILKEAGRQGFDIGASGPGTPLRDAVTRRFLAILNAEPRTGEAVETPGQAALASGQDYEARCQQILEADGWSVATTPVTGDQGADLVADRGGRRLVVQCKSHAKPVGNKAVQEAFGALGLHGGDLAVVVSPSGFTRSAEALAQANGVLLLHHEQLAGLGGPALGPGEQARRRSTRS